MKSKETTEPILRRGMIVAVRLEHGVYPGIIDRIEKDADGEEYVIGHWKPGNRMPKLIRAPVLLRGYQYQDWSKGFYVHRDDVGPWIT